MKQRLSSHTGKHIIKGEALVFQFVLSQDQFTPIIIHWCLLHRSGLSCSVLDSFFTFLASYSPLTIVSASLPNTFPLGHHFCKGLCLFWQVFCHDPYTLLWASHLLSIYSFVWISNKVIIITAGKRNVNITACPVQGMSFTIGAVGSRRANY